MKRFAGQTPSVANILGSWIDGRQVPQGVVWQYFNEPRDRYLLDPVALAQTYGARVNQALARNSLAWEGAQANRSVDLGAAELDLFLRNLGIRSNLSGLRKPPNVYYPIADEIHYKRQFKPAAGSNPSDLGTIVEFLKLTNTPMMDWDLPGPSHMDRNVTVRTLGDVEELLRQYVAANPQSRIQLYQTPGGFRAWEVAERLNASEFQPRFAQLQVDPDYARLSQQGGRWSVRGVSIDPPGFSSRISHKPGRLDWVAQPLASFGQGLPDPTSQQLVRELHDEPIRRAYLGPGGVSPQAMAVLQQQLPSASAALRQQLAARFGL